jgi:hypothetical protein
MNTDKLFIQILTENKVFIYFFYLSILYKLWSRRHIVKKEVNMLWTIAVILVILWLLGLVSNYTMGGFIHVLLVIAIVVVLVNIIRGRRPLG